MPQYIQGIPFPILSRYEIRLEKRSILGMGGMGTVFKAQDRLLNKDVAIKTIKPELVTFSTTALSDSGRDGNNFKRQLFLREAMSHARLGLIHPTKILPVNNYGIEDDTPFMELELLHGGSLRNRMDKAKSTNVKRRGMLFSADEIKNIIKQICSGLKVLHDNKVYHSDLKPENVLFTEEHTFELKIADLGLARIAESGLLTRAGVNTFFGGTMHYTPQNVTEGIEKANERTDIYSVGIMIFEMLTREPLRWSKAKREFVESRSDLSDSAKNLIKKACQLTGRNYSSISQLEEALETLDLG